MLVHQVQHGAHAFRVMVGDVLGFAQIFCQIVELSFAIFVKIVLDQLPVTLPQSSAPAQFMKFPVEEWMFGLLAPACQCWGEGDPLDFRGDLVFDPGELGSSGQEVPEGTGVRADAGLFDTQRPMGDHRYPNPPLVKIAFVAAEGA